MITLTTYEEAREAFRCRDLRQGLYDEGVRLMDGVIVNLHGDPHIARRRLENRLFRRDTFAWYERDRIPMIIDRVLEQPLQDGSGDLLPLARHTMMALSVDVAGVDIDIADTARFARFADLMNRLAKASTVAHATGDKQAIKADGDLALESFEREFYQTALEKRTALIAQVEAGTLDEGQLPKDVLTTLLRNHDRLPLPPDTVLREIAYFPWVGSHSTSAQLVHAMHHIFEWLDTHPGDRDALIHDDARRQQFVHESMRLHPASPVAMRVATVDIDLKSGRHIPADTQVSIDVEAANRDISAVGAHPERFDPDRIFADGVVPWVLSFGHGSHACLAQELAGGLEPDDAVEHHLLGGVTLMAGVMLKAGARPDPDQPAMLDRTTTRHLWGTYPVRFTRAQIHQP